MTYTLALLLMLIWDILIIASWVTVILSIAFFKFLLVNKPDNDDSDIKFVRLCRGLFVAALLIITTPFFFEGIVLTTYIFSRDGTHIETIDGIDVFTQKEYNRRTQAAGLIMIKGGSIHIDRGNGFLPPIYITSNITATVAYRYIPGDTVTNHISELIRADVPLNKKHGGASILANYVLSQSTNEVALIQRDVAELQPWNMDYTNRTRITLAMQSAVATRLEPIMTKYSMYPTIITISEE